MNESRRSHRSWGPRTFGVLGLLLAAGCFYQFDNPVEKEPPGSVAGTIALQGAVGNQTAAGGMITVQWTNGLELSLTTSSKFLFQDLPDGTYSLEVTIPPAMGNDFPLELLRPDVLIPNVGDMIDSLDIGTLQVPASGTVGGTVTPPAGKSAAGIVVGAFAPGADAATPGTYEGFSTNTDSTGHYSFQLPAGNHVLAASDATDNAVGPTMVISGSSQTVDLTLTPVALEGQISGSLVGSGYGVSATGSVPWDEATYVAFGNGGALVGDGGLISTTSGASAGVGSDFQVNVPGGQTVTLTLLPAPEASTKHCDNFGPFVLPGVPVIAGISTALGQVTWLNNAALGANGIGPCADGGSVVVMDGGGVPDGGPVLMGWIDAGVVGGLDGGNVAQTGVYPLTSDAGGIVVAWIEGHPGTYDVYAETQQGNLDVRNAITFGKGGYAGLVTPGTLSGAQFGGGTLLTFATSASSNPTVCAFFSPGLSPPVGSLPPFPNNPAIGPEQTTTFAGQLDGGNGVFVFQAQLDDAGVVGVFSSDGVSFGPLIGLEPGGAIPVMVDTLIGTSCDVADLKGKPGFCLAGSGALDIDGGSTPVGFVSSFATDGPAPVLSAAIFTAPPNFNPPIYVGLTALPGEVAVAMGTSQEAVYYWTLTDLTVDAGGGTVIGVATDLLLSYDGSVLGLSQPAFNRTDLQFLPNGAQPDPLPFFVNGGDFPAAYVDPLNNDIVTAGVASMGPDAYNGTISILRLAPDAG